MVYKFKDINQVKFTFGDAMSDAGKDMGPPGAAEKAEAENKPITFSYKDGVLTQTQLVDLAAGQPTADKAAAARGSLMYPRTGIIMV